MHKPALYIKNSILAQADAEYVLSKHVELLQDNVNYEVLDVGCGPGNVTYEKILPLLSKSTMKIVGVDISSDNIEYARKHYQMDPRLSYQVLDILTDSIPSEYIGGFDLVVSLYCFHFVGDHRKALSNIHKMLKPRGKVLISFMAKSIISDIYHSLRKNPKWNKYMGNFNNVVPPTQTSQSCEALLNEIGFKEIKCEEKEKDLAHTEENLIALFDALNLFEVTKHFEEFVKDALQYFHNNGYVSIDNMGKKQLHVPHTLVVITATKF